MQAISRHALRLLAAFLLCAFGANVLAVPVVFEIIEEVDESLFLTPEPAVSSGGTVAFVGTVGQSSGVFTGNGVDTTFISNGGGLFSLFNNLAINSGDAVAFTASGFTGSAILLEDGGPTKTIVDSLSFSNFGSQIGLNDSGSVALIGTTGGLTGVYVGNGMAAATPVVTTNDGFTQFPGGATINDSGTVAFVGASTTVAPGVFIIDGGVNPTVTDAGGNQLTSITPVVSLNNNGTTAFAGTAAGLSAIFTGVGNPASSVADVAGPYALVSNPAIDNAGNVAFLATLDAGGEGIFAGPNPDLDTLVAVGDTIDRATVTDIKFGPNGLANGRIAFAASLSDGRTVIVRGDFAVIPEPASLMMLGLCSFAAASRRR